MKKIFCLITLLSAALSLQARSVDLSLIPPGSVSDKVNLDIRAGIVNDGRAADFKIKLYCRDASGENILKETSVKITKGDTYLLKYDLPTAGMSGKYEIELQVRRGLKLYTKKRPVEVIPSETRSLGTIDGAYAGIAHWSEIEGRLWNSDIRKLTAEDWKDVVKAMHHIGMDIIVIQELFRSEHHAGRDSLTLATYDGKAYYPSKLYPGRQDVACEDAIEAIMEEADKLGMYVLPGIGLYSWFDYSEESLQWHKDVTREVFDRYGHHDSFYGFYVSEESNGALDNWRSDPAERKFFQDQIVDFFREYKAFCRALAPAKPVMMSPNCYGVGDCREPYMKLLENLDILCSFCFARMPENDLTGKECADLLQSWCDEAGSHLWFDLEAFLFNPDQSLYAKPFEQIKEELLMFDNFEKIICYQYPGVFNNPSFHPQVGEDRTLELYNKYMGYRMYKDWLKPYSVPPGAKLISDPKGILRENRHALQAVRMVTDPTDPRFKGRGWQEGPTITADGNGVMYLAWDAGKWEETMGNYITVSVSEDGGQSWKHDKLVICPSDWKNTVILDPTLWTDSKGRVHLKYSATVSEHGDICGPQTANCEILLRWDGGKMRHSRPQFLTYGLFNNPPLELPERGEVLYPVCRCTMNHLNMMRFKENPERGTYIYMKKGRKVTKLATVPPRDYSVYDFEEGQIAPLSEDGKDMLMVTRWRDGLHQSFSHDYGRSWSEQEPMTDIGESTSSRASLIRLASGNLLLLYNNAIDRSHMTAALSTDGGQSWPYKVLVDERAKTSYPAACQLDDGTVVMVYDRDRTGAMDILFCTFTEEDLISGRAPEVRRVNGTGVLSLFPQKKVLPELEAARGEDGVTLLQFSDLHGCTENLERIVEFCGEYDAWIDDAIHVGDAVWGYWDNDNPWTLVPGAERVLNIIGNHDCWKGHKVWAETNHPYDATQQEAYSTMMVGADPARPLIANWGVTQPAGVNDPASGEYCACYYYKDYPSVRLVVLDCIHFDEAQAAWLEQTLEQARRAGLAVVAATHYPPQSGIEPLQTGFSCEWAEVGAYEPPVGSQMERMPDGAYAAVDAFIEGGGTFVCWLSGHEHYDLVGHVSGHSRQLVVIVDKGGYGDGYMREARIKGTDTQDAFNLVTVNPETHLLTVQRIGCSVDEAGRSKKLLCYDYIVGEIVLSK